MAIGVTYDDLEEKYGEVTAEKLSDMAPIERQEYYEALYQYVGYLVGIVHQIERNEGHEEVYPGTMGAVEYHLLSAAENAHTTLLDALAGLVAVAEDAICDDRMDSR